MNPKTTLKHYLSALADVARTGDAREESFYAPLAEMLRDVAVATDRPHISVTTQPRPTDAGNPDLRLWNGVDRIVGYVEVKAPHVTNLDAIEATEQLQRYRGTFPNLILTNLLELRLYRDGALVDQALLGRPLVLNQIRTAPPLEQPDQLLALLDRFLAFSLPVAYSAEELARALAVRTRFLRDTVEQELAHEATQGGGPLTGFLQAFRQFLIGSLTPQEFADLYAQTITYGLFAARTRATDGFTRRSAYDSIPRTIGILRDVFRFVSLGDLPAPLEWVVDDIAEVLAVADAPGILHHYYHEGKGSDPIVHFYETFLAAYDPAERERRGVYYTPEPVVSYIVRSLHRLLQSEFGLADGLADPSVTLLDPAAGTMTFVAEAAKLAVETYTAAYGGGARQAFIRERILRQFYAFELMMAPYAVGHLKMSFLLEELGHRLTPDERMPFYLTNTLEMEPLEASQLPGLSSLAEESKLAGAVKRDTPILVILGNPPYSGHSTNTGDWITELIEDYKMVDGQPLGERNIKWLQDDYVKFLRFAEWKIAQAGHGVVGMITNHGYLDNPTFRGMRWHLLQTYDEIRVLDLHGNSLKKETCPDGSPDENVFDIQAGVAVVFFIKRGESAAPAKVYHAECWGDRESKYRWLQAHNVADTPWQEITPRREFYLFVPRDAAAQEAYQRYVKIPDLFPVNSVGIVTARDGFVLDFQRDPLERRIRQFRDANMPDAVLRDAYRLRDSKAWSLPDARRQLRQDEGWENAFAPCLYRPFDVRWLYYHTALVERDRREVMRHMLAGANLALVLPKRVEYAGAWQNAFVTEHASEHVAVSLKTTDYHLPLYLYPDEARDDLFAPLQPTERQPNLDPALLERLAAAHGAAPTPEDVFHYVYAVLYAPTYRQTYAQFLRIDFPRVPFTADANLFRRLAALGERLVALHLLRSPELDPPLARFEGDGDNRVARTQRAGFGYDPETQRVGINADQWFAPVPPDVWAYQIGGYQVCEKWLKDRRDRVLTLDEIRTYCRIVTALARTIALQSDIDALYPAVEDSLL